MTERERQVVALLRLVDEWVPGPRLSRVYAGGKAPRPGSADAYLSTQQTPFAARYGDDRRTGWLIRDGEIRRLELARLHEAGGVDDRELEPWEAAKLAILRQSSMPELVALLESLRREVGEFSVVALRVVFGYVGDLKWADSGLLRREAEVALSWVTERMPSPIRLPPGPSRLRLVLAAAAAPGPRGVRGRAERDEWIRELVAEGRLQKDVAAMFDLQPPAVSKILKRVAA